MNKIALVTGANKGIGKEIARQLSGQGITVLLGSRDPAKGEAAVKELRTEGHTVEVVQLDVTNETSVAAAARYIQEHYGKLDVLVNNAGIAVHNEQDKLSIDAFKQVYAVNVFGVVAVTEAMLPLLQKAKGRIINVSSELGSFGSMTDPQNPFFGAHFPAYNSSKSALNAVTLELAKILQKDDITCNAVDPGFSNTDLNNHTGPRPVQKAAQTIAWLATMEERPTGKFYHDQAEMAW